MPPKVLAWVIRMTLIQQWHVTGVNFGRERCSWFWTLSFSCCPGPCQWRCLSFGDLHPGAQGAVKVAVLASQAVLKGSVWCLSCMVFENLKMTVFSPLKDTAVCEWSSVQHPFYSIHSWRSKSNGKKTCCRVGQLLSVPRSEAFRIRGSWQGPREGLQIASELPEIVSQIRICSFLGREFVVFIRFSRGPSRQD